MSHNARTDLRTSFALFAVAWFATTHSHAATNLVWQSGAGFRFAALPVPTGGQAGFTLLPPGETGEIVYRGPSTMSGYLHDEDATDQAFAHGWFHSGDVGRFGDDGVLWFTDRHKDVIKTGGENVASIEVEKAVYAADPRVGGVDADPRVAEVVVVGLPHQRWSEAVTAFVVTKPGERIDAAELIAALKTRLDGFKVPKSVIFVDQLPKTSTGKIQKNVVRSGHAAHYAATDHEATPGDASSDHATPDHATPDHGG